jgi:hypothetical protein
MITGLRYGLRLPCNGFRYDGIAGMFTVPRGRGAGMLGIAYIGIQYVMLTSTVRGLMYRYDGMAGMLRYLVYRYVMVLGVPICYRSPMKRVPVW